MASLCGRVRLFQEAVQLVSIVNSDGCVIEWPGARRIRSSFPGSDDLPKCDESTAAYALLQSTLI
jgi:hypothetical protein